MLPAAMRLRRRAEFAATIRGGQRGAAGVLVVHLSTGDLLTSTGVSTSTGGLPAVAPEETGQGGGGACVDQKQPPARAGFVVAKTVGTAVVRNRVRRRLRALIRPHLDALPAGSAIVVRALPAAGVQGGNPPVDLAGNLADAIARARRPRRGGNQAQRGDRRA